MGLYGFDNNDVEIPQQDDNDKIYQEYSIITECVNRRFISEAEEGAINKKVDKFIADSKSFLNQTKIKAVDKTQYSKGYTLAVVGAGVVALMSKDINTTASTVLILTMIKKIVMTITRKNVLGKSSGHVNKNGLKKLKDKLSKITVKDVEAKKKINEIVKILDRESK